MTRRTRSKFGMAIVSVFWMMAVDASGTVYSQETPEAGNVTEPAPEAWGAQCSSSSRGEVLECSMEQRLVLEGSGQFLARLVIKQHAPANAPVLMIHVPLGVSIPTGLRVGVDGEPGQSLGYQTCDAAGCYAGDVLSNSMLDALKKGKTLSVAFENSARRPIKLDFSLLGFTKTFEKIK